MSAAVFYHKQSHQAGLSRTSVMHTQGTQASVGKHTDTRNNLDLFNFSPFLADFSNQIAD